MVKNIQVTCENWRTSYFARKLTNLKKEFDLHHCLVWKEICITIIICFYNTLFVKLQPSNMPLEENAIYFYDYMYYQYKNLKMNTKNSLK